MTLEDMLATWTRPDVLRVAGLSLISVLLWRVPGIGLLFYPFRLLNTFVHELSHGAAALLTGGRFHRFVVYRNRAGLAQIQGGNRFLVISAGYLGPALFGGGLILLSATALSHQTILLALGCGLGLLCLLFVRNLFGIVAGLLLAGALAAAGWYLSAERAALLFALLAMQMPLSAIDSLIDLLQGSLRPRRSGHPSDAAVLAGYTGVPALIWAGIWCLVALSIIAISVTLAYADRAIL